MSAMFRSLRFFNYRLWTIGAIVSNTGAWMQRTAQDCIVLTELTDHDAAALGFTMALQFGPLLSLMPIAEIIADRFDRRVVLPGRSSVSSFSRLASASSWFRATSSCGTSTSSHYFWVWLPRSMRPFAKPSFRSS